MFVVKNEKNEFTRLLRLRKALLVITVICLFGALFMTYPCFLARRNELSQINNEIVSLQHLIVLNQSETRKAQATILHVQTQLAELSKR